MTAANTAPGLVSVVIATYNCRRYLGAAIASVLAQTYDHLELHVVDDGSSDGTAEEVAQFLADPRVRYHYQANAGHAVAKNNGIAHSRGEFVGFCDADDLWLPGKLALQVARLARNPRAAVVYSRTALMNEQGTRLERRHADDPGFHSGQITPELFKRNFIPFGTALVRRRCLDSVGGFDPSHGPSIDWELWLRLSVHYEFLFVDEETHVYRVWPGQMSRDWRRLYDHAFRIMREFQTRHPGALPRATVRDAWSHSYMQRARLRTFTSGEYLQGVGDVVRAIQIRPTSHAAWKTLPAIALAAAGLRRSPRCR